VFLDANGCRIHAHGAYPTVCTRFPLGGYEWDVDICPELLVGKHPELDRMFDPATKRLRVMAELPDPVPASALHAGRGRGSL
jgi:hypothetical protein